MEEGDPPPTAQQRWAEAVQSVWVAGRQVWALFGSREGPPNGAVVYLVKVLVAALRGRPAPDPFGPPPPVHLGEGVFFLV